MERCAHLTEGWGTTGLVKSLEVSTCGSVLASSSSAKLLHICRYSFPNICQSWHRRCLLYAVGVGWRRGAVEGKQGGTLEDNWGGQERIGHIYKLRSLLFNAVVSMHIHVHTANTFLILTMVLSRRTATTL